MPPYNSLFRFILLLALCAWTKLSAQLQHIQALLNSSPSEIELQSDTYISDGCVEDNYILLQSIPNGSDGYVDFYFSNLKKSDDLSISLEEATTASSFYRYQMVGNQVQSLSHQDAAKAIIHKGNNGNLFRIEKCGNSIHFYQDGDDLRDSKSLSAAIDLVVKVSISHADNVALTLTFEPSAQNCATACSDQKGTDLKAGDLMLLGYDNFSNGSETDRLMISNIVPLKTGTSFSLSNAVLNLDDKWYASSSLDGQLAVQQITYIGTTTLAAGSIICLDVPHEGGGSSLLLRNFSIDDVASDEQFCVTNKGQNLNPNLHLPSDQAHALFLFQGPFQYTDAYALLCGKTLSGLQYGGNFLTGSQSVFSHSGFSQLPPEIACIAIEDGLAASNRHAFYEEMTSGNGTARYFELDDIANFSNWTVGGGDFPPAACAARSSSSSLVQNSSLKEASIPLKQEKTKAIAKPSPTFSSQVYPNPFEESFTLALDLPQAQKLRYRLVNALGQNLYQTREKMWSKGQYHIPIQMEQQLEGGFYFVHLQSPYHTQIHKICKMKN